MSSRVSLSWNELAISKVQEFDRNYVSKIPHIYDCFSQKTRTYLETKPANFSAKYTATFAPLIRLNEWLLQDEFQKSGALKSYAIFLVKLPLRAVRNVVQLPVTLIKALVYAITHPAKASIKLITTLISLLHALTQPETWSKMGVGILGATLGQTIVGNPLAPLGLIVGSALLGAGLCGGALMKDKKISDQLKQLPEAFLTGFLMGLVFGTVTKVRNTIEQNHYKQHLSNIEKNKLAYAQQHSPAGGRYMHYTRSGGAVVKEVNPVISNVQVNGDTVSWTTHSTIKTTHYIPVYPYTPASLRIIVSTTRSAEVAKSLTLPFHFSSFNPSSLTHHAAVGAVGAAGGALSVN